MVRAWVDGEIDHQTCGSPGKCPNFAAIIITLQCNISIKRIQASKVTKETCFTYNEKLTESKLKREICLACLL